jgi:predicted TIM-barrel fold metal-dependent hydrolase
MTRECGREQALYEQISAMPTVDAHEHLHPEPMRTGRQVDIFLLFHQYLLVDLESAGMDPEAANALGEEAVPLERKWESVAPYLDRVITGSVAGPPLAALRKFFGEEHLTRDNYVALTERMRAHNTPGVYERVLREACNIDTVLNQNLTMWQTDLFRPILFESSFIGTGTRESLEEALAGDGRELPSTLDGYVERMEELLTRRKREGMVGVKGYAAAYHPGVAAEAAPAYERLIASKERDGDDQAVVRYLRDRLYEVCARLNLVAVLHSGIWAGNWADIETIRPTHVTALACAHRKTRFDLFHAASPQPADAGFLGRSLPNVYLNSCWSHLLSPRLTLQAWDMWLDMMPINRVMAWGGDYWWAVENVWGALDKVRRMLAELLARRMGRGDFGEARALEIARRWMHDNAREIYFLA